MHLTQSLKPFGHAAHPYTAKLPARCTSLSLRNGKQTTVKFKIVFEEHERIKPSKNLQLFHQELSKYETAMLERYGWIPHYERRIASDSTADILGFVITEHEEIAAVISMLRVDDDKVAEFQKMGSRGSRDEDAWTPDITNINDYMDSLFDDDEEDELETIDINYEIAMVVLPRFQRCGIGTALIQSAFRKFHNKGIRIIAVAQSNKSRNFLTKMHATMHNLSILIVDSN